MNPDQIKPLMVVMAALTRRRPEMLSTLIGSLGQMNLPENTSVSFLIVENDDAAHCEQQVLSYGTLPNGGKLDYVHEPDLGIPVARNRAAKEAIARGADLLAFVDDDEIVAQDWLVEMIKTYRNNDAVLLGGPMRLQSPEPEFNLLERMMHANLVDTLAEREVLNAQKMDEGKGNQLDIFTGNWLGETRIFSEIGLWFDENMRFTGGTDSKFSTELKAKGHTVGWAKNAYAYEAYPRERLSFSYQHQRAKGQYNNLFHQRMKERPLSRYSLILRIPRKAIEILFLAISVPLTRGKTLLKLAKRIGWVTGRVAAAFGVRSTLYTNITGG